MVRAMKEDQHYPEKWTVKKLERTGEFPTFPCQENTNFRLDI